MWHCGFMSRIAERSTGKRRETEAAIQTRKFEALGKIDRADEQIGKFKDFIGVVIETNIEPVRSQYNFDSGGKAILNSRIDSIVFDIRGAFDTIVTLLPSVGTGRTGTPIAGDDKFARIEIRYGPEQKSALLLITALKGNARFDPDALGVLVQIANSNRELGIWTEARVGGNGALLHPDPKEFTVGFVPKYNTEIEGASFKLGSVVFSQPNLVIPSLRDVLEGVSTLFERVQ